jgi:hypothetical protein
MRAHHYPDRVQRQLDKWEQEERFYTEKVARAEDGIVRARQRLTGGFQKDSEYHDLRRELDRLVKEDKPALAAKLACVSTLLSECKNYLAALPDDVVLEPVKVEKNGLDLQTVLDRIAEAQYEINTLRKVPVPSSDIAARVREYVASLVRPQIDGIGEGETLHVSWPNNNMIATPEQITNIVLGEIDRLANLPMPLPQRKRRIAELQAEIDELRWQARALGALDLPPAYLLGVKVVKKEVERRVPRVA